MSSGDSESFGKKIPSHEGKDPSPQDSDLEKQLDRLVDPQEMRNLVDAKLAHLAGGTGENVNRLVHTSEEQRRREAVERVQKAKLFSMRPEDLERKGGVMDTYEEAHLTPDIIRHKLHGNISTYNALMSRGVFVFGFDEHPVCPTKPKKKSGVSEFERMLEGLQRNDADIKQKGRYCGYYLAEERDAPVLSWATFYLPPPKFGRTIRTGGTSSYADFLKTTIDHGVTGGGMEYLTTHRHSHLLTWLSSRLDRLWYFDTIQQRRGANFAADRLFFEMTNRIHRDHPKLETALLYRLGGVDYVADANLGSSFEQCPDVETVSELLIPGKNLSSDRFFTERGCNEFAYDLNMDGPAAEYMVDGEKIWGYPLWVWMAGDMKQMHDESRKIWENVVSNKGNDRHARGHVSS